MTTYEKLEVCMNIFRKANETVDKMKENLSKNEKGLKSRNAEETFNAVNNYNVENSKLLNSFSDYMESKKDQLKELDNEQISVVEQHVNMVITINRLNQKTVLYYINR